MDRTAKNFLLKEELERHIESMSKAVNDIDVRQQSKVVFPAPVIMMSALLGIFAYCQTWNEIADFAEARLDFLKKFFHDLKSTPSHDTIRRFFCIVNPDSLERCYKTWAASMKENMGLPVSDEGQEDVGKIVAIDGKTICNAMNPRAKNGFRRIPAPQNGMKAMTKLHMVSAFLVDQSLSLDQEKVENKKNKINPQRILSFKKKHWGIEIGLHWQLDVTFNEDDDRKRKKGAQNFSLMNKMVLNVIKCHHHKDKKASVKRKRMKAAWDEKYLESLLIAWIKAF